MAPARAVTWLRGKQRGPVDERPDPLPRPLVRVVSGAELQSALERAISYELRDANRSAAIMARYEQLNGRPTLVQIPATELEPGMALQEHADSA